MDGRLDQILAPSEPVVRRSISLKPRTERRARDLARARNVKFSQLVNLALARLIRQAEREGILQPEKYK